MNTRAWLWLGLAASLLLLAYQRKDEIQTTIEDIMTPRGIRNNNPGNIRHGSARWQGMAAQQTDEAFVQFTTPEYGIRALSKLLDTYYTRDGLNTVRKIIAKYAPSNENNTEAYAQTVARALNVLPDTIIYVGTVKKQLVAAIIKHENGDMPYTVAQLNSGVSLA